VSKLRTKQTKKEDNDMWNSLFSRNTVQTQAIENISALELHELMQKEEEVLLLDVRTPAEYAEGHIAGARLLPLSSLGARMGELPQDVQIVCVCRSGARSMVACENLSRMGFTKLSNLGSGMIGWQMSRLPVSRN
jgi:rhodanese-related sulfurtransferase